MSQTGFDILVLVNVPDAADAGDHVHVYWDSFTGTVSYTRALTARAIRLFPEDIRQRGWGKHPWSVGTWEGKARRRMAWDTQRWGTDPWARPPPYTLIRFKAPNGSGIAKFGIKLFGPTGVAIGSAIEVEHVLSPEDAVPLSVFALDSYDAGSDVAKFTFTRQE